MRKQLVLWALDLSLLSVALCAQAASPPRLSAHVTNGVVRLRITADAGSPCAIQCATNLSGASGWQLLTNVTPLNSDPVLVVDSSAGSSLRIYRAFSQAPPDNINTTNMVWIPPGTFVMGSPTNEALRNPTNETQHTVTLTRGFFMGKYLVSQGEFVALMNTNISYFKPPRCPLDTNLPIEQITWYGATNYCWALTVQAQLAGTLPTNWVYRLPTESEWEYACRAGAPTALHYGNALHGGMANFSDYHEYDAALGDIFILHPPVPYLGQTARVGSYLPNAWGLYDMHGNLWEWCQDWFGAYPVGAVTDPQGAASGSFRVQRGGSWQSYGTYCRSAFRQWNDPNYSHPTLGFRMVLAQLPP
jgi:formylglycine-generating enzyme required for sulfatase activity